MKLDRTRAVTGKRYSVEVTGSNGKGLYWVTDNLTGIRQHIRGLDKPTALVFFRFLERRERGEA